MSNESRSTLLFSPPLLTGGAAFLLGVTGILTIVSSRYDALTYHDTLLIKQTLFLVAGLGVMFVASAVPFRLYRKYAAALGGAGLFLLLILPLCGSQANGMRGWLKLGAVSLQPSELMKAPFLLVLAVLLAKRDWHERRRFGAGMVWLLLWMIPVMRQPDFGTAVVYFGTFVLLCFAVGGPLSYLAFPLPLGIAAAAWFVYRHLYAWQRLCGFIDPWRDPLGNGWHTLQFRIAVARGKFFGVKLGRAVWSNNFLPLPYNDSSFATLSETLGFAGGVLVCGMLALLISSLWRLAKGQPRCVNRFFITGVMLLLALQGMIHISVNLCLLPTTGLTMPFVSYGGSSLVGCFLMLGMALSAGNERERNDTFHNNTEDVKCEV